MGQEVQQTPMPRSRSRRARDDRAEHKEQDDEEIRGQRQSQGVGQTEALEGMAADQTDGQLPYAWGKSSVVAEDGNGQSGADSRCDRAQTDGLPQHDGRSRRSSH